MRAEDKEVLTHSRLSLMSLIRFEIDELRHRADVDSLARVEAHLREKIIDDELRTLIEFIEDIGSTP
jgi:hypothetical protein